VSTEIRAAGREPAVFRTRAASRNRSLAHSNWDIKPRLDDHWAQAAGENAPEI